MFIFYFVGGGESGGIISLIAIYGTMLGIGSNINIVYIMIELRVPPAKLGQAIVVVITGSVVYSTFASIPGYSTQPIPFLTGVIMVGISLVLC